MAKRGNRAGLDFATLDLGVYSATFETTKKDH